MAMKGSDRFCTVTEYRVDARGNVDSRMLGGVDRDDGIGAERYVRAVCATQGEGDSSVVVVQQELYGVNVASFVCRGGEVVKKEGGSGCFRADELIEEVKEDLKAEAGRRRMGTSWWRRVFGRRSR